MTERTGYIYHIKCSETDMVYIGSCVRKHIRKSSHFALLKRGAHHSHKLQKDFDKYGRSSFSFEVIEEIISDRHELRAREQYWINALDKKLYNTSRNANGPSSPMPEAFREKCRDRMTGNTYRRGEKMADESKAMISKSLIGNTRRSGIKHTDEVKRRISEGLRRAYAEGKRPKLKPGEKRT